MDFEQLKVLLEAEVGENAGRVLYTYFLTSAVGPVLAFIFGLVLLFAVYKVFLLTHAISKYEIKVCEWGDLLGTKTPGFMYESERIKTIKKIDEIVRSHKGDKNAN